jgi:hypothetical protein
VNKTFWLTALAGLALSAGSAQAQCYYPAIPQAPDACGPGYYVVNQCGAVYGPNYMIRPPYLPFQGMVFPPKLPVPGFPGCAPGMGCPPGCAPGVGMGMGQGAAGFGTHPFTRSPRDWFMYA